MILKVAKEQAVFRQPQLINFKSSLAVGATLARTR